MFHQKNSRNDSAENYLRRIEEKDKDEFRALLLNKSKLRGVQRRNIEPGLIIQHQGRTKRNYPPPLPPKEVSPESCLILALFLFYANVKVKSNNIIGKYSFWFSTFSPNYIFFVCHFTFMYVWFVRLLGGVDFWEIYEYKQKNLRIPGVERYT